MITIANSLTRDPYTQTRSAYTTQNGSYQFFQNGTEEVVDDLDFRAAKSSLEIFMHPKSKSDFYNRLMKDDAYKGSTSVLAEKELFSSYYGTMFYQISKLAYGIRDNGGMVAFPDLDHFKQEFEKGANLTSIRLNFLAVIKECIGFNYLQAQNINEKLDDAHKITIPNESFAKRVAKESSAKSFNKGKV